ncbi:MAG: peptidylprolyl isomerase [Roseovarius sp.]
MTLPKTLRFARPALLSLAGLATCLSLWAAVPSAQAQSLFSPAIRVNDEAITWFEIEQRARMMTLFRAPGDPERIAREQLIEDRLKLDAAEANGIVVSEAAVADAMEEFANRGDMSTEDMVSALEQAGVDRSSFRDFVLAGVTWREVVRARFANRVSVDEDDVERARLALSGTTGVQVLLSEIVLPVPEGQMQQVMQRANELSEIESFSEFAAAARRFSAAPSAQNDGRLEWTSITQLPEQVRSVVLALAPGEVTEPLATQQAVALLQLRDIAETATPDPRYSAIEYAMYYIDGGRSEAALKRAAEVEARVDVCDDLYGIAQDQSPEVLVRESKAPGEIPQDIAMQLGPLDPGEVSTALTRNNGQTLVFLMLCGRSPELGEEGPSPEELSNFIRNRRLDSYAKGYLEQLRAEARIVEKF